MASFEDLSSTLTQHPSADTFSNVESFPSGRAALDMCDVAPTRSSPRSINNICSLLLGPASEPPRESRRPRCPPISPDGKRPISFPHHGFLEMESRWPAQTDADDCRKTEWGFHPFSFLGAALHVLADLECIFGFGSWPMQHGICGNLSEQALPCCLSVLTVLPLPSILSGNDASPEHPSLLSCPDRAHTDDGGLSGKAHRDPGRNRSMLQRPSKPQESHSSLGTGYFHAAAPPTQTEPPLLFITTTPTRRGGTVSLPGNGCPPRRPHDGNLQVGTKAGRDGMNNKYQLPGCCAVPVCFFHISSCLCPTRPLLENLPDQRHRRGERDSACLSACLSRDPTIGGQLPPCSRRPGAAHAHAATLPRSVPASVGCCPAPRLDRRLADWRLDGAPHGAPHTRTALKSRERIGPPLQAPSATPPPPQQSRAAAPESKSLSVARKPLPVQRFCFQPSRFQPSAPDLFFSPPNHAGFQQSRRVSPRAKRKPQHPEPPSPAAAGPRQWHHDGHAWRKPI